MLTRLVDVLRCPAAHAESPLVLAVETWDAGRVLSGTLSCPVCHASYPVRGGVAEFAPPPSAPAPEVTPAGDPAERAWRLAAQLNLLAPGRPVLLTGRYAGVAAELAEVAPVVPVCVDRPGSPAGAVTLAIGARIPVAPGTFRGAAIDAPRATPEFLEEVLRVTAGGGRLVAPAGTARPPGVELLADDDQEWIGRVERTPLVRLGRR